jgi:hypothetical protein
MLQYTQQQIASIVDICEDNGADRQRVAQNQWGQKERLQENW